MINLLKICITCNQSLLLDQFSKDKSKKDGFNPRCKNCFNSQRRASWPDKRKTVLSARRKEYHENIEFYRAQKRKSAEKNKDSRNAKVRADRRTKPLKYKNYALKKNFGITLEIYDIMAASQNGVCKICKRPNGYKNLAVDHSHESGKIRGLLCENCNKALGMFQDSTEILQSAIKYLKESSNGK